MYKERLLTIVSGMFLGERSGHDIHHLERVFNLALRIQEKEGGDKPVIGASALLHDIHRLMQNQTGKYVQPRDSLDKVREILIEGQFAEHLIGNVLHCVEFHEQYDFSDEGKTVRDIETLILQDADNLDAIGAIGIGRTFTYGGAHGVPMWEPGAPLDAESPYDETAHDPSTIHHFYRKLLRLHWDMNTETGKRIARSRHRFMEEFVLRFLSEWRGEV